MAPQLKYLSPLNTKGGFFKSAGDLVHLQGMMELECPGYSGPRITEELEENLELMTGLTPLQLRSAQTDRERSYLEGKNGNENWEGPQNVLVLFQAFYVSLLPESSTHTARYDNIKCSFHPNIVKAN